MGGEAILAVFVLYLYLSWQIISIRDELKEIKNLLEDEDEDEDEDEVT